MSWKKWVIGEWSWKRLFRSLALIYGCLLVVAVFFAEKLIFMPPEVEYADDAQVLKLSSSSGETIASYYLPAKPGYPTLIYTHGNAEDLGSVSDLMETWNDAGLGVLAYDFPGYGHSTGSPNEKTCGTAITAAWDYLTVTRKIPATSIVLVGRSVGGGPTVWRADRVAGGAEAGGGDGVDRALYLRLCGALSFSNVPVRSFPESEAHSAGEVSAAGDPWRSGHVDPALAWP